MFDITDTTSNDPLELAEQCMALASAVIHIEQAAVKESLQFILHEKMAALFTALNQLEQ
ncbi:hypothetical protein I2494_11700 [Budviciaceae bacterium BWR-B9]|uniref:DUF2594 family protein n=1 Tax=Limnobaculum allomyrinae TaxID=2791986 RepID=A0ABS1IRJ6_9GAMM|nr:MULTISPECIES: hypothetical protein [Limnobaculum]MBK5144375.1 hypothetical protein [Limnobaculum allomyrinae]MBV7691880.1 hypothetical protein [Limnobaculum sp. M2-1]